MPRGDMDAKAREVQIPAEGCLHPTDSTAGYQVAERPGSRRAVDAIAPFKTNQRS